MNILNAIKAAILADDEVAIEALLDFKKEAGLELKDYYVIVRENNSHPDLNVSYIKVPRTLNYEKAKRILTYDRPSYSERKVKGACWAGTIYPETEFAEALDWIDLLDLDSDIWAFVDKEIAKVILQFDFRSRFINRWQEGAQQQWGQVEEKLKEIANG